MKRRQRRKLARSQYWVAVGVQVIWWILWIVWLLPRTITQLSAQWSTLQLLLFIFGSLITLALLIVTIVLGIQQGRFSRQHEQHKPQAADAKQAAAAHRKAEAAQAPQEESADQAEQAPRADETNSPA